MLWPFPYTEKRDVLAQWLEKQRLPESALETASKLALPMVALPKHTWAESLSVLDTIAQLWPEAGWEPPVASGYGLHWLDVGAKNFAYAPGLWLWGQQRWPERPVHITGIEIQNRRYWTGYTRQHVAQYYAQILPNTQWLLQDVAQHQPVYELITWFLPFVFAEPHRAWGLRPEQFNPLPLLQHVLSRLLPGGMLLITNQGLEEHEAQLALLEQVKQEQAKTSGNLHIVIEPVGALSEQWLPYQHTRYGIRVRRNACA